MDLNLQHDIDTLLTLFDYSYLFLYIDEEELRIQKFNKKIIYKMKFYFSYLILLIFIISNKLFLFNEEFLILICFIAFCFVVYSKLTSTIQIRFDEKINTTESLIFESLLKIEKNLESKYYLNKKIIGFKKLFISLKNYYVNLTNKFLLNFVTYIENLEKSNVLNKLFILKFIELEYSKFIFLLITKKINSLSRLIFFLSNHLLIKRFKIFNKINLLILLKKI